MHNGREKAHFSKKGQYVTFARAGTITRKQEKQVSEERANKDGTDLSLGNGYRHSMVVQETDEFGWRCKVYSGEISREKIEALCFAATKSVDSFSGIWM